MLSLRIPKPDEFWKVAFLIVLLRLIAGPAGFLAYVIIAIYGARGRRQTVEAILLSWFVTLANVDVFGHIVGETIGRFFVIFFLAGLSVVRLKARHLSHTVIATVILGVYIILHSLLLSGFPVISFLKGMIWLLAMLTVILSFTSLGESEFDLAGEHIYGFLVFLLMFSFFVYMILPAGSLQPYSYLRGVLGHSQAAGVMGGLLSVWAFGKFLDRTNVKLIDFLVFLLSSLMVFLSGARTGFITLVLCVFVVFLVAAFQRKGPGRRLLIQLRNPIVVICAFALSVAMLMSSVTLMSSVNTFFGKGSDAGSLAGAYSASRGDLIEAMLDNIRSDPLAGIGFGIASDSENMKVEKILGIPISAVVEKGVTHLAVWEELGLLGMLLAIYWLAVIILKAMRGSLVQIALISSIFLQNFGEATLFSAGGMGLLQILLIGYAAYRVNGDGLRQDTFRISQNSSKAVRVG